MDQYAWFEWLSNNVPGGIPNQAEWIERNKVIACHNSQRNQERQDKRCSNPDCFKTVRSLEYP